jgi:hypothetical protein
MEVVARLRLRNISENGLFVNQFVYKICGLFEHKNSPLHEVGAGIGGGSEVEDVLGTLQRFVRELHRGRSVDDGWSPTRPAGLKRRSRLRLRLLERLGICTLLDGLFFGHETSGEKGECPVCRNSGVQARVRYRRPPARVSTLGPRLEPPVALPTH